jgi:hypothetical protein
MKLRYVGVTPVSFTQSPVGEVFPGDEFEVPDDQAEGLLAHARVEQVPAKSGKTRKELPAAAEPASLPVLAEPAAPAVAETA